MQDLLAANASWRAFMSMAHRGRSDKANGLNACRNQRERCRVGVARPERSMAAPPDGMAGSKEKRKIEECRKSYFIPHALS